MYKMDIMEGGRMHVLVHVETHPHTYPQNEFTGNTFVCVVRRRVFSGSEYSYLTEIKGEEQTTVIDHTHSTLNNESH